MGNFQAILTVVAVVVLSAGIAQAQTVPTLGLGCKFQWDAYVSDPAAPAATLKMYLIKDNVQQPAKTGIPLNSTIVVNGATVPGISCKDAGVTTPGLWKANLHAVAADGTESAPSNGLTWTVKVIGPPQNFRAIP